MKPIFIDKRAFIINIIEKDKVFKNKQLLVKPSVLCTSNRYIVDINAPYPAIKNDATILEDILSKNSDLIEKFKCNEEVDSYFEKPIFLFQIEVFEMLQIFFRKSSRFIQRCLIS